MINSNFTMISNDFLDRTDISLDTMMVYIKIKRHITKNNWEIRKDYVQRESGLGVKAFSRVWKELIDKGLLISECTREAGKFKYIHTLVNVDEANTSNKNTSKKDNEKIKESKAKKSKNEKANVVKENVEEVTPIDGQIHHLECDEFEIVSVNNMEELMIAIDRDNETIKKFISQYGEVKVAEARCYLGKIIAKKPIDNVYGYLRQAIRAEWKVAS